MNHNDDTVENNSNGGIPPSFIGTDYSGSDFGSVFGRRDSFGSNSSGMMMSMGVDDISMMDDRFFSFDDNHPMNPDQISGQKNNSFYPEPDTMASMRPMDQMQIHPEPISSGILSENKDSKQDLSSGIPPIISIEEAKLDVCVNANSFICGQPPPSSMSTSSTTTSSAQQQQQPQHQQQVNLLQVPICTENDKTVATKPEPRKKLWKCTFPGCTEPPKTHYNCYSHVWDSHIRHGLPQDNPLGAVVYKKIADKTQVKELCKKYMIELDDGK